MEVSDVLPGLVVERVLGRGGTAVVYLARQDLLDRQVAVKVITAPIDDPKVWRDFQREAQVVARLSSHPNVVTVHTTGSTADGRPFLVTSYLDGGSLADTIVRHGPLPPAAVARLGIAVADALAAAHALGILHRDVKPGNVLLGKLGEVQLADFGIARLVASSGATTTGQVAFTPQHVAPEVLRGDPQGPWTDVYGLASTLVTALTGRAPFERASGERVEAVLARRLTEAAPPLPPHVPSTIARPLHAALANDPADRPSLGELRAALASIAQPDATWAVPVVTSTPPLATRPSPAPAPEPVPIPLTEPLADDERRGHSREVGWIVGGIVAAAAAVLLAFAAARAGDGDGTTATTLSPASPTSETPTTAVPATTAAPITTIASTTVPSTTVPSTTVPPTTAPPTTPPPTTVAPSTAPPQAEPGLGTGQRRKVARDFAVAYYARVADREFEAAWAMLTPSFQEQAGGYDAYVDFWEGIDGVEVRDTDVVDEGDGDRPAVVQLQMRYEVDDEVTDELDELTLVWEGDEPRIDGYRVVSARGAD